MHPLHPAGPLLVEILIQAHPGPGLQHMGGRDPGLGQVPAHQQLAEMQRIPTIGLRSTFRTAFGGRLRRLSDVSLDPGPRELLNHVPPTGATLDREGDALLTIEARQERTKVLPVRRDNPTPLNFPSLDAQIVQSQLAAMQIQASYDGHGTSSSSDKPIGNEDLCLRSPFAALPQRGYGCAGEVPTFHLVQRRPRRR